MTDKPVQRRRLPLTITAPTLLVDGTDTTFRELITSLVCLSENLITIRKGLSKRLGVTGPQYGVLFAIAQLQNGEGVSVSKVAQHIGVTGAFVTTEVGKLARRGLVNKAASARDRRAVLLTLTQAGHDLLERFAPQLQAVNNEMFGGLSREEFSALLGIVRRLTSGEARARERLEQSRRSG